MCGFDFMVDGESWGCYSVFKPLMSGKKNRKKQPFRRHQDYGSTSWKWKHQT